MPVMHLDVMVEVVWVVCFHGLVRFGLCLAGFTSPIPSRTPGGQRARESAEPAARNAQSKGALHIAFDGIRRNRMSCISLVQFDSPVFQAGNPIFD